MTSLPNSPLPSSITRVAEGLSGVPIIVLFARVTILSIRKNLPGKIIPSPTTLLAQKSSATPPQPKQPLASSGHGIECYTTNRYFKIRFQFLSGVFMKLHSIILAGLICALSLPAFKVGAADDLKTIANLYENKATLVGQTVSVQGKVVKVVKGIKKRNFIHIQDGTGDAKIETNDLTATTTQIANVDDTVTVTGTVVVNRDFGAGYLFPLLLEEAVITPAAHP
jgi:hypothetical protein